VVVGVSALIVVMAVMNGLQRDLREKILIGSPDLRLLTFGQEMNMPDWRTTLEKVRKTPNVIAAAPCMILKLSFCSIESFTNGEHQTIPSCRCVKTLVEGFSAVVTQFRVCRFIVLHQHLSIRQCRINPDDKGIGFAMVICRRFDNNAAAYNRFTKRFQFLDARLNVLSNRVDGGHVSEGYLNRSYHDSPHYPERLAPLLPFDNKVRDDCRFYFYYSARLTDLPPFSSPVMGMHPL